MSAIPPTAQEVQEQLRRRLLSLSYHAFARCLCLLLARLGYEDVRLAGRTEWKGRNREGGYDIEATLPAGVGRRRVIVQAKQYDALPVFQRGVDELRGTCLRAGADEALLVTTSAFSPVVAPESARSHVAPVRLLDGAELISLMLAHRVGVWEEPGETAEEPRRLGIDHAYFEELSRECAGNARRPRQLPVPRRHGPDEERPRWVVTVSVCPLGAMDDAAKEVKGGR